MATQTRGPYRMDIIEPQEQEILRKLATGSKSVEICDELGLRRGTLSQMVFRLRHRLGYRTTIQMLFEYGRWVERNGRSR